MSNAPEEQPSGLVTFVTLAIIVAIGTWVFSPSEPETKSEVWSAIAKLKPTDHAGSLALYTKLVELDPSNVTAKYKKESAQRKLSISSGFSSWDGSHKELEKIIKGAMNDPDSYEHIETKYVDNEDYLTVVTRYRGKNVYGGKVVNSASVRASIDGRVLEILK